MKIKIFAIALALVVGLSLCVPVFAYVVQENPSLDEWLLPSSINFTDDESGNVVSLSCSPVFQTNFTETYCYGERTYYTTVSGGGDAMLYDFMYDDGTLRDCSQVNLVFPAFHIDYSISPPAFDPTITINYATDYVTVVWTALVSYYDHSGVKFVDRYLIDYGDTLNATFDIPVNELRLRYAAYDYVNIESLQCSITVSDATASSISVTRSRGQGVVIGYNLPDALTSEVIEITPNLFDWIITPLSEFLNIQIVPPDPSGDFGGATIGGILALVVAIPMLVAFLKVFAGG